MASFSILRRNVLSKFAPERPGAADAAFQAPRRLQPAADSHGRHSRHCLRHHNLLSHHLSRHFIHAYDLYKEWRRRRRRYVPSAFDAESPPYPFDPTEAFHALSPYGLDKTIIKIIPLSGYAPRKSDFHECTVCLLEFEIDDYVRTLPVCAHTFHVDCIDIWLWSHANCPLCRSGMFWKDSLFTHSIDSGEDFWKKLWLNSSFISVFFDFQIPADW